MNVQYNISAERRPQLVALLASSGFKKLSSDHLSALNVVCTFRYPIATRKLFGSIGYLFYEQWAPSTVT